MKCSHREVDFGDTRASLLEGVSGTCETALDLGMSKVPALARCHGSGLLSCAHASKCNGVVGLFGIPSPKF